MKIGTSYIEIRRAAKNNLCERSEMSVGLGKKRAILVMKRFVIDIAKTV